MRQKKKHALSPEPAQKNTLSAWRLAIWLVLLAGTLSFWPSCLDRYLAPRFFFLSAAMLISFVLVWRDLREHGDWRLHSFDLLLLGWYGLNLASVSWALSWSEGVFYAQKSGLLFLVYWFIRQALWRDADMTRQTLRKIFTLLTWTVCGVIAAQVMLAVSENGLNNETLYDYAIGLFGNKGLASDFLFFLLVFTVLLFHDQPHRLNFWIPIGLLGLLILLLQTRTVYVALALCGLIYFLFRTLKESGFRRLFLRKILPAGLLALALGVGVIALKGRGSSLSERLNPLTYLDSDSANERRFVWYKTDLLNQDHFWLGVGNGSWKFWFPSKNLDGGYRLEEQNVVFTRAHNDYLEIQAEMGIVGLFWFCALFGFAFLMLIRVLLQKENPETHDVLVAGCGLLGYCVIQFFDFPRERIELQVVLAVLFAWVVYFSQKKEPERLIGLKVAPMLAGVFAGGLLVFNLLIGWYRMQGEILNVHMLDAQSKNDWKTLVSTAAAAENTFYQYTEVAIPLSWHEGIGWYQMGQTKKAVDAFKKAYQLNPWSFQVLNNYASALVKHQQFREAVPMYEQVMRINPSFDDGKMNLSFVHFQLGNYPASLEWLNKVDTIPNPGNETDRLSNRRTLARQAEFRKALQQKMK